LGRAGKENANPAEPDNFQPFGILLKGFFIFMNYFIKKKDF
jgi:hypothetical protein